jgi:hypothetical protein
MTQRIAIFLRKTQATNHFRRLLTSLIGLPNLSSAVITSGFYQEGPNFFASSLFRFPCSSKKTPLHIKFVGVYNGYWTKSFATFVHNVQAANCLCCVKVDSISPKGHRWHAKLFIGSINNRPRFGILGSSNLTRPAADISKPFNFEADAVFWYETDTAVHSTIIEQFQPLAQSGEILMTTYNPSEVFNSGRNLEEHLQSLQDQLLSINE